MKSTRRTRKAVRRGGARTPARFFGAANRSTTEIIVGDERFIITIFLSPSDRISSDKKAEIRSFFIGNKLGIDDENIETNLRIKNWDAVLHVKNEALEDRAVGTLQWAPWCPEDGEYKLWIHDISRIDSIRGKTSPVKVLMDLAKGLAKTKGLKHLYLIVDEKDRYTEPPKNKKSVYEILTTIYEKPDYKFVRDVEGCMIGDAIYTSMKTLV